MYTLPFGTTALARLMGKVDRANLRAIWIYNKTLSLTNGHMLIRRFCDVPDGYYCIADNGQIYPRERIPDYPDLDHLAEEHLKNPKQNIRASLSRDDRGKALVVAHAAKDSNETTVWCHDGFWIGGWDSPEGRVGEKFPLNLPSLLELKAEYITIALTELARYDDIYVIKSEDPEKALVLGLNWGSCVVVTPMRGRYTRSEGEITTRHGFDIR